MVGFKKIFNSNFLQVKSIKDVAISLGAVPALLRVVRCVAKDLPDK